MNLTTAVLRLDETTRCRLFVALNAFPVFALLKAITRHFAKPTAKVPYLWSILTIQNCVGRPFAQHRQTDRCRILLAILNDVNAISHRD
jgi:hypothetical protein